MKRAQIVRWVVRLSMPAVMLAAPTLLAVLSSCSASEGEALFYGREPLAGHLTGDASPLPARVTRCVNCHEQANLSPVSGAGDAPYAPRLGQRELLGSHVRRGGPPSHFNKEHFCSLLREGVDPARVVISTVMPRYQIDDRDCGALWMYMLSR